MKNKNLLQVKMNYCNALNKPFNVAGVLNTFKPLHFQYRINKKYINWTAHYNNDSYTGENSLLNRGDEIRFIEDLTVAYYRLTTGYTGALYTPHFISTLNQMIIVITMNDYRDYDANLCNDGGKYATYYKFLFTGECKECYVIKKSSSYLIPVEEWVDEISLDECVEYAHELAQTDDITVSINTYSPYTPDKYYIEKYKHFQTLINDIKGAL